jgi:hypothetical protein
VTFTFNLELDVDTHTGALVGMSLRDNEDGAAVAEALVDGVAATGAAPVALLLDNRSSNHTDEVVDALGETLKIRRTQGRPQNGAHVEGAFGLFQQMVPAIVLDTLHRRELARGVLGLVVQTWARTLNHRPRNDSDGRSRVQRYEEDKPTPDQVEAARAALQERLRKQELARQTRAARLRGAELGRAAPEVTGEGRDAADVRVLRAVGEVTEAKVLLHLESERRHELLLAEPLCEEWWRLHREADRRRLSSLLDLPRRGYPAAATPKGFRSTQGPSS